MGLTLTLFLLKPEERAEALAAQKQHELSKQQHELSKQQHELSKQREDNRHKEAIRRIDNESEVTAVLGSWDDK